MSPSPEPESTVEIIDITPELWEIYKEIRLRGLQEDPKAFGRSYEEELAFPEEKWKSRCEDSYGTLAMEGDKPIGMISGYISEEDNQKVANIVGVFVATEARRKRVGSRLMQRILEKIKENPEIGIIRLNVNKEQLAAVGLYNKFGFKIITEENHKMGDGEEHTEYVMELNLNKTPTY